MKINLIAICQAAFLIPMAALLLMRLEVIGFFDYIDHSNKIVNLTIVKYITPKSVEMNIPLQTKLDNCKKNEVLNIQLVNNYGGYVYIYEDLRKKVRKANCMVVFEVEHLAASAAAMTLFMGDLVKVHRDSKILFHVIRYVDPETGETIIPTIHSKGLYDIAMFTWSLTVLEKIMPYTTPDEYKRMLEGEDIIISGKELCNRGVNVIHRTSEYCLITGNRTLLEN